MRATRIVMGMPITIDIVGADDHAIHDAVFAHFEAVDRRFSTYRADSEIAAINFILLMVFSLSGKIKASDCPCGQLKMKFSTAECTNSGAGGMRQM